VRFYLLLLALSVLGNAAVASLGGESICGRVMGILRANVVEEGNRWGGWYGYGGPAAGEATAPARIDAVVPGAEEEEDDDETLPVPPVEIIVRPETDPTLLEGARAAMIARRARLRDVRKLEQSAEALRGGLGLLEGAVRELTPLSLRLVDVKLPYEIVEKMKFSIAEEQNSLLEWEWALVAVEEALDLLDQGRVGPSEVNEEISKLSKLSKVPFEAMVLDTTKIIVPGEGCEGMDYTPLERLDEVSDEEKAVVVARAINVGALDPASDAPILLEEAQAVYEELLKLAQSKHELLPVLTSDAKQRVQEIILEELRKKGLDEDPPSIDDLHTPIATKIDISPSPSYTNDYVYTARDAVIDIDRALEREDADRTGKFDYASINNGARVLRRGPFATSYSLFETLPLLNRVLAYTKLRFYGHPPEVALRPTFPMHARGQCWSFPDESASALSRRRVGTVNDLIGEYGTLTVNLASAITVTEVMVEHIPPIISHNPTSAIREFRVLGFEDGGAFGNPWELGSFTFATGSSIQAFSIPTTLDGQNVPMMKAISIAVDSNGGARYSCLYRVRVHGV
jgi:hypothetical protein